MRLGARRKRHSAILPSHTPIETGDNACSASEKDSTVKAKIEDLRPGHFIEIPGGWWSHHFIRSKFLIESPRVIDELRAAGIERVVVDLEKSTIPFPAPPDIDFERSERPSGTISPATQAAEVPARDLPESAPVDEGGLLRGAEMRRRQEAAEQAHTAAPQETQFVLKNMLAAGPEVAARTREFVGNAVSTVLADDATLHLLSGRQSEASLRFHSLQVMTLGLLTGKRMGLSETELQDLATAAIFTTGISRLQDRKCMAAGGGNRIEQEAYQSHVLYSVEMAKGSSAVSKSALAAILTHHEAFNGSGYPKKLTGDAIPLLGRILAVADRYDYLVNPQSSLLGMTPAEALARLFQQEGARF